MATVRSVVESERRSDGTIISVVKVSAVNQDRAERKALRAALRDAGYVPPRIGSTVGKVNASVESVEEVSGGLFSNEYDVTVKIENVGEYFQKE